MKAVLCIVTMTAAILVLVPYASSADMPQPGAPQANPQAQGFTLKCLTIIEIVIENVGKGPVPAGTAIKWEAAKGMGNPYGPGNPARSGTYTFQQPLPPNAGVTVYAPPSGHAPKPGDPGITGVMQAVGALTAWEQSAAPCKVTVTGTGPVLIHAPAPLPKN